MIVTKICNVCGVEQPITDFYKESSNKDGYRNKCKECYKRKPRGNFSIEKWYQSKSNSFKERWSWEDIKWIYDNYLNITKQELLNKFVGIKYKTLTNIIYSWDIKKTDKMEDWSEEDIKKLTDSYPYMTEKDLHKLFPNRTWHAIKIKASKLNIKKDEETLRKMNSNSHMGKVLPLETRMKIGKKGKLNHNWKGGVSPLHPYLREKIGQWKLESLKKYNFKCSFTGINDRTLVVHHLYKSFSQIIQETFAELNLPIHSDMTIYTTDELNAIDNKFRELHYRYGLGVVLTAKLHRLFHSLYGKTNNTVEQFYEFKQRYINREFEEQKEVNIV